MKTVKGQQGLSPVYVHAGLAVLAVLFAYQTWTRDRAQTQTDSVVVLDVTKREVASLAYLDETRDITVERRTGPDGESYPWIVSKTKSKVPANPPAPALTPAPAASPAPVGAPKATTVTPAAATPPAKPLAPPTPPVKGGDKSGEPAMPAGHPPLPADPHALPTAAATPPTPAPAVEMKDVTTVKEFRGNDGASELLGLFGPLKALRALGSVDEPKAKELGLTDSKKTLTISAKGLSYKFTIGGTSYGSGDYYVRDAQGQVFLLSQRIVADFEFADSRLMERRLHRFERADFDRIEVKVGEKTRTFVQGNRQNPQGFFFADSATPDKRDDSIKNWMDKLLRVAISDYVAQGEEPATGAAAPAMSGAGKTGELLTVRFFDGRKELGHAVLSRYVNAKTNQPEYFARTETSIGLVRLLAATAESVVRDAGEW
jgi:hypothetical protein